MLCADTSFLFSLYLRDKHSETARARLAESDELLLLSSLNIYELGNALRLAEFRGLAPMNHAEQCLEALDRDRLHGRWRRSEVLSDEIIAEAGRLSATHTLKGGHRAFDILHVAHARLAKPKVFLSFDANQLRLAKAAGLRC